MTTNSDIRIHAANNLNVLKTNKLQRFIVEPIISYKLDKYKNFSLYILLKLFEVSFHLLKERYQLRSSPFVRLGQIDVLEEQDETLALLGLENTPAYRAHLNAHLRELLQHMTRVSLRRAVNRGHLS